MQFNIAAALARTTAHTRHGGLVPLFGDEEGELGDSRTLSDVVRAPRMRYADVNVVIPR